MEVPKIHLSPTEYGMMIDAEVILTKNRVMEKMKALLATVQSAQLSWVESNGLSQHPWFAVPPKISRGENYLGLPWLILDYPRLSSQDSIFFIRNFFWWGRGFSSTLQISGRHRSEIRVNLEDEQGVYVGINEDPWLHHFEENNFVRLSENRGALEKPGHLKLSVRWPLSRWQEMPQQMMLQWTQWLERCGLVS